MKKLFLMRHGKSSWDGDISEDRDRPLSKRGKKNAEKMGERLAAKKFQPDLVLASNAARSRQTAEIVMAALKYQGDVCYLSKLYLADTDVYAQEIQGIPDDVDTALVIGHSPALDCILQMTTHVVDVLATAAVAELALPVDSWKDFHLDLTAELVHLWRPKELEKEAEK